MKNNGSIMDTLSVGICILTLSIIMIACFNSLELVNKKFEVNQLARKYILRMETVGYLTSNDKNKLNQELLELGIVSFNFEGTTLNQVGYGNPIILCISGYIHANEIAGANNVFSIFFQDKDYEFYEIKMSTAKN